MIIVAELGINHNGDVEIAKKMMDIAKVADCDYVKFQKRTVEKVYTAEELDRPRKSPWGTTNREQKIGLEFGREEYDIINTHSNAIDIPWFASPWDVESVDFLEKYDLPCYKIASASITDKDLLERVRATNRAVIISTGMSTREEVWKAVDYLGDACEYILACTSTYPTLSCEMNLKFVTRLKNQFPKHKIGFSNHHPGIIFALIAAGLGAEMIEFHMTLDRSMYGSDQAASIEIPGVFTIVRHLRDIPQAMGSGAWTVYDSEKTVRDKLRKKQ